MIAFLLSATLLAGPADERPVVAMVLQTRGKISLQRLTGKARRLAVMDRLRAGDKIIAGPRAEVTLFILAGGWHETLRPGARATLGPKGCSPDGSVTRFRPRLPRQNLDGLREELRAGKIGGVGLRDPADKTPPPRITPILGTTVLTGRPSFCWPPVAGAQEYQVLLLSGAEGPDGRRLWKATAREPHLAYPKTQAPLHAGYRFRWRVTARLKGGREKAVVAGKFFVATRQEVEALAGLRPLAESKDSVVVLLAAAGYEAHGVLEEALRLYERLAESAPQEPAFQQALANFYERAGQLDRAKAARARAQHLRSPAGDR
jgi:hypothetical protein